MDGAKRAGAGGQFSCFGAVEDRGLVQGGGLVIDYRPVNSDEVKRVVLAFTEEGMWVEIEG